MLGTGRASNVAEGMQWTQEASHSTVPYYAPLLYGAMTSKVYPSGNRIGHAFPDAAMFEHEIEDDGAVRLVDLVEGVFVSGTDRATKDQIEMYGVGQREADEIVGPLRLTGFNPRKTPTGGIF